MDDARVDWSAPALAVERRVRAYTPDPGAWTTVGDHRVRLGPVLLSQDGPRLAPGRIAVTAVGVLVGTGSVPVVLGEVAPAGRRAMTAAQWARGARLDPATRAQ